MAWAYRKNARHSNPKKDAVRKAVCNKTKRKTENEMAGWRVHGPEKDGYKRMDRQSKGPRDLEAYCGGGQGPPRAVAPTDDDLIITIIFSEGKNQAGPGYWWCSIGDNKHYRPVCGTFCAVAYHWTFITVPLDAMILPCLQNRNSIHTMCDVAPYRSFMSSFSSKHYEMTETEHVSLNAHSAN